MAAPLPYPAGIRACLSADADAILAGMLAAHERGELPGVERHFLEESADRLRSEPGLAAVAEEDGLVAGWIVPEHDDLMVDLPFRRRGHGSRLVQAGRLLQAEAGRDELRLWVPHRPSSEAFARATGMAYHSSLWKLRLDPEVAVAPPRFADDVVVRWIEAGSDDEAFVELVNTTFLDHASPLEVDLGTIRRVHGTTGFDPSTILLVSPAADPDRLTGFCRVGSYGADDGRLIGEVKLVGVRREARGRGLGRELVRWGVQALAERGARDTYLSVEGRNAHALRLYESIGFRQDVEWPHWTIPVT